MARRPRKVQEVREKKTLQLAENLKISKMHHDALLKYVKDRLDFGKPVRDALADRYEVIDKELAGYIKHDPDDLKRVRDNEKGEGPKAVDNVLPLVLTQLDESMTYMMTVIAPDDGMYSAIAVKDKQDVAKGFASLMNKNDKMFHHYRNYAKAIIQMLKYNFGGLTVDWTEIFGSKLSTDDSGDVQVETKRVFAGNRVQSIDMYNFIYDISVPAIELNRRGEFFANVSLETPFRLRKMQANKEIFDIDNVIKSVPAPEATYYRHKPTIRSRDPVDLEGTDWTTILSAGISEEVKMGFERVEYYGWVIPSEFGLNDSNEYQIWRFTVLNGVRIAAAEHLNNAHGFLPCALGRAWEDDFETQTKSFAELLIPYQQFASFQMNVHQRASRKALYGTTIYNERILPNLDDMDLTASKIPVKPAGQDFDLRKAFIQFTDTPDTSNTLRDIEAVDGLMQKILPTDILRQLASLERATQYQAAATVQGSNRRNHKIAKTIDSQCLTNVRYMQMYNIYQFQEEMEILDEEGNLVKVNPAEFREANIEFDISDGLKGIDKLAIAELTKDVINMMLQSQIANDRIDIVEIIDWWTSLIGEKTDFKQFKFENEFDKLSQEEKQIAFQLLQQAVQEQAAAQGGGPNGPSPIESVIPGAQNAGSIQQT